MCYVTDPNPNKTEIECTGKDGKKNTFLYSCKNDVTNKYTVLDSIITPKDKEHKDFFLFAVTIIDFTTVKVTVMDHNKQDMYKAKGIPEKMIEEASRITKRRIISSTNNCKYQLVDGEYRTPPATKVWKRLVEQGKAEYDREKDIYKYVGKT